MKHPAVQAMTHTPEPPLQIEREYTPQGREVIVIEGVRYDAEYFRTFSQPETDVLYAVRQDEDGAVKLTVIRNRVEAAIFFDETFGADPNFSWDDVKKHFEKGLEEQ